MSRSVNGILLLDKPLGLSSNGVLQRLKRLFAAKKAGHTGSLDPLATGMLPICFGEATKFSQFLLDANKSYEVMAKLGERTSTGDEEGEIIATAPVLNMSYERIKQTMQQFLGEIEQVPPMFSAIKIQGKPLYELARRGIEVERKSRKITIFSLTLENVTQDTFSFRVHCSKGTYVRTLVEDIGESLQCGAHVTALRRIAVHPYGQAKMHTLPELETLFQQKSFSGLDACLLPIETSVRELPEIQLTPSLIFYLKTGQAVRVDAPFGANAVRLVSSEGQFLGIGMVLADGRIKPERLLQSA